MSELEQKISKLLQKEQPITESEAQDLAYQICELPEIKGGQVGAEVIKKNAGNILTEQARHYLGDCLNELKYSRPVWEQKLIYNWISEWNAQKVILSGDTWTAEDILGDEE